MFQWDCGHLQSSVVFLSFSTSVCCIVPGFWPGQPLDCCFLTVCLKFCLLLQIHSHRLEDSAFWNPFQPLQCVKYVIWLSSMATCNYFISKKRPMLAQQSLTLLGIYAPGPVLALLIRDSLHLPPPSPIRPDYCPYSLPNPAVG